MINGLGLFAHSIITDNPILFQGLGIYILLHYTKNFKQAFQNTIMLVATMLTAGILLWITEPLIPTGFGMNLPFILLLALFSGLFWHKLTASYFKMDDLYIYLPTFVNSALVGILLKTYQNGFQGAEGVVYGFASSLGFGLVLIIMTGIRQRLELAAVPKPFRGYRFY